MKYDFRLQHNGQQFVAVSHHSECDTPIEGAMDVHEAVGVLRNAVNMLYGALPDEPASMSLEAIAREREEIAKEAEAIAREREEIAKEKEAEAQARDKLMEAQKEGVDPEPIKEEVNEVVEEPAEPKKRRTRRARTNTVDEAAPKPRRRSRRRTQAAPVDPEPAQPLAEEPEAPVRKRKKKEIDPKYSNEELAKLASEVASVFEDGTDIIIKALDDFDVELINQLSDSDRPVFAQTMELLLKDG